MQKSFIVTTIILTSIYIYQIVSQYFFIQAENLFLYRYFLNPIIWLAIAVLLKFILYDNLYINKKLKNSIIQYILIGGLIYVILYLILGLFTGFSKSPYSITIKGVFINIWITGTLLIAREYVRYRLINNVYEKYKVKIGILLVIVFSLIEFDLVSFLNKELNSYYIFENIASSLIPIVAKNIMFTYIVSFSSYIGPILYQIIINLFLWVSPILSDAPWIVETFISTMIPAIIMLYIIYTKNKKNIYKLKHRDMVKNPVRVVPLLLIVVVGIWFVLGVFPIRPLSIASGSMKPTINVGDVVIIKKCIPEEIEVGDIIEFSRDKNIIVHRAIKVINQDAKYYFTTKGDNNKEKDTELVTEEMLMGKYMFKIKYIGYPAIWLLNR